jgi:hypothetical protein
MVFWETNVEVNSYETKVKRSHIFFFVILMIVPIKLIISTCLGKQICVLFIYHTCIIHMAF